MLQRLLPEGTQTNWRSIVTDTHLQVKGSQGSIFALGDASTIEQVRPCLTADRALITQQSMMAAPSTSCHGYWHSTAPACKLQLI